MLKEVTTKKESMLEPITSRTKTHSNGPSNTLIRRQPLRLRVLTVIEGYTLIDHSISNLNFG